MNWLEPISDKDSSVKVYKNKDIKLSQNSRTVLEKRYLRRGIDGKPTETIEQMFERIAEVVAQPDAPYTDLETSKIEFYNLLTTKRIFSTLRVAALIQQVGGGNGFSFSDLRPKGGRVVSSGGKATGPVGFLSVYDKAFNEVAQGGARRGANMAVLRVDHPDIRDFIKCKSEEGEVANFNISVAVRDKFMKAVEQDTTYELIDPHTNEIVESPKARDIFNMIVSYAHKNGEPGVLFIDEANRSNPVPHLYELKATNPCGEQWLGPYENCCLGSINLNELLDENGLLDWDLYQDVIEVSTRFLDNVVTANKYIPVVPELKEAAENVRRIGLGIMGLADAMYSMGIRYGSDEGNEFAAQVSEFMRYHAMKTSIELAEERGPFLKIKGSIYDPENLKWESPKSLRPFSRDFGRPRLDWDIIVDGIKQHGIRNGAQTTIAPTGTISTVAGVEGYGCEPAFALAYLRNVYQAAGDAGTLTLTYVSPYFEEALTKLGYDSETRKRIVDKVVQTGTCQNVSELPEKIRNVFVVSADITPDEHVTLQASIQAFIDNSISKTCNFPEKTPWEDVAD